MAVEHCDFNLTSKPHYTNTYIVRQIHETQNDHSYVSSTYKEQKTIFMKRKTTKPLKSRSMPCLLRVFFIGYIHV